MGQNIKSKETYYDGYRFRSRLEARWAVFFNNIGLEYEYEVEGFDMEECSYLRRLCVYPLWTCRPQTVLRTVRRQQV